MKIEIPWGDKSLGIRLPSSWDVIYPCEPVMQQGRQVDEQSIVSEALNNPIGDKPLAKKQLSGKNILIVVDDNTRPTPVYKFFHLIIDALESAGATPESITTLTALGIHTPMSGEEMAQKIGRKNIERIFWENHDAFDDKRNVYMGKTESGTPVYLNRRIKEADVVVLVGLIEPHLMAGFGGGMKNILPGIASAYTIGHHHEILAKPPYQANRVGMAPEENLFRLDLEDVRNMINADIFCINTVLDPSGKVTACFAGDPIKSHRVGVKYTIKHLGVKLDRQVDGVITCSWPMDINFKQSMKCVGNTLPALKKGGVVMGFLKAERGLDDIPVPDGSPIPLPVVKRILRILGPSRVYGFLNMAKKGMDIEEKFLYYYTLQLIREYELYLYVPSLTKETIKKLFFFKGVNTDPDEVIRMGAKKLDKNATVAVFTRGGASFPVMGQST